MEKGKSVGADWATAGRKRRARINALICAVCAAAFIVPIVIDDPVLQKIELATGDLLTDQRGGAGADERLVLVGIDDASLDVLDILDEELVVATPALDAMSYGWRFPRSVYAELTQKLIDAGARLVVFDMVLFEEGEGDEAFKAVIDANPERIVIGCNLAQREISETNTDALSSVVRLPSQSIMEIRDYMDPRLGHVNFFDDIDSRIRELKPVMRSSPREGDPLFHSLAVAALKQLKIEGRVDESGLEMPFRFPEFEGVDAAYQPLPFYTLFVPYDWEKSYKNGTFFEDKIVYVGGTSILEFHDQAYIPGFQILGVQLQMSALAAALNGDFYTIAGKGQSALLVILMAVVTFGIAFVMRRPLLGLLVMIGCGAIYLVSVRWFYFELDWLLPSAAPALTLGLAGIGCFGSRFALELLEKARLRRTLERQVSKELADHILSVPEGYFQSLPGVRKPVTVLFSDIRSFTTRSEKDDPVKLVSQLKEYLDAMGKIVFEHGGVVDKFIGDAVMAVWGNLRSEGPEADTRHAVAAAIEMQRVLALLNSKWEAAGREGFKIGIGLNHGDAIFGMMGSEQKQEMTVIGDPVNQAARLEGLTKKFGMGIVIGPRVTEHVRGQFLLRSLGNVRTMGKKEAEELSAVLGGIDEDVSAEKADWLRRYHEALEAFAAGDLELAGAALKVCAEQEPDDLTVPMYLEAIASGERSGVLVMTGK